MSEWEILQKDFKYHSITVQFEKEYSVFSSLVLSRESRCLLCSKS